MTAACNLNRPSIPLVIAWVKTAWEHILEQMVSKSFLKCISNKTDGTEDSALFEDFLGEGVAETEDVVDNDGYDDYFNDFPATPVHKILDYDQASFFTDEENDYDFEGF